jgi:hypothetical protein
VRRGGKEGGREREECTEEGGRKECSGEEGVGGEEGEEKCMIV